MSNTRLPADAYRSAAAQAVDKWLAAGGAVGRPRVLPPWEEFVYFEQPKCRYITDPGGNTIQLVEPNMRRVAMLISSTGTVYVAPDSSIAAAGGQGIQLTPGMAPLSITQKLHGNLCQVEWFVSQVFGTVVVTVIEVILRDWPNTNR